ncbi:hypothetical protein ABZ897_24020 [Nonomuraea sp. NPDC046802]|uniref:hypothetical protein n=1 Tax=Nonomuraea sp. NPDC046802 TaxID=3154919 RepID=UPI0033F70817
MKRALPATAVLAIALAGCAGTPPVAPPATPPLGTLHPGAVRYHATDLRPGDCIDPMPTDFSVTVVPCDQPHAAEFATTYIAPRGPYPGEVALDRLVQEECTPLMRYVPSRKDEVTVYGLIPLESDWPRYRALYCLAVPADGGPLVGRVIK